MPQPQKIPYDAWFGRANAELLRRSGIDIKEGAGLDDRDRSLVNAYEAGWSPNEWVESHVEENGLKDEDNPPTGYDEMSVAVFDQILEGVRPPPPGTAPFEPYAGEYDSTRQVDDVNVGNGLFASVTYAIDDNACTGSQGRLTAVGGQTQDIYSPRVVGVLALDNIGAPEDAHGSVIPTVEMYDIAMKYGETMLDDDPATGYGAWM